MNNRHRILFILIAALVVAGTTVLSAYFSTVFPLVLCMAVLLTVSVREFGLSTGLWLVCLAAIPLRLPLSIDIVGTVSIFPTDFLIVLLLFDTLYRGTLGEVWKKSIFFRIGIILILLSLPGLYTASRLSWGINALYRTTLQVSLFAITFAMIRSATDARRALMAIVLGIIPALAFGIYQSTLPSDTLLPDWAIRYVTYSVGGEENVRISSTFKNPLHFSHYLSICIAICLGLLGTSLHRGWKLLLVTILGAGIFCNLNTYSIGGILGMMAAFGTILLLGKRKYTLLILPVLLLGILVMSPEALITKAENLILGKSTSSAARLVSFKQSFDIVRDKPVLGVGWGGIRSALEEDYRITRATAVAFTAENYFLQHTVALGFPGLFCVMAGFVLFLKFGRRLIAEADPDIWPVRAVFAAGITFYFQGQFFPATEVSSSFLLWPILGILEGSLVHSTQTSEKQRTEREETVDGGASS